MCDQCQNFHNMNIQQYHPNLQKQWQQQITAYVGHIDHANHVDHVPITENFIEWDDPYKEIGFWKIIDFLRDFKLTK